MRLKMKLLSSISVLVIACIFFMPMNVNAEGTYKVSYVDFTTGAAITTGGADTSTGVVTMPNDIADAYCFVYNDCCLAKAGETVNITQDTTFYVVKNSSIDDSGAACGNMTGGLIWFISDNKLYLGGNGAINYGNTYGMASMTYSNGLDSIYMDAPEISYDRMEKAYVGDEKEEIQFGRYREEDKSFAMEVLSGGVYKLDTKQVYYDPAYSLADITWIAYAEQIEEIYVADTVSFNGNMTLFFNLNSVNTTNPEAIGESVYKNLKNIYLFADTKGMTSSAGLFARCPSLEHVYVRNGERFHTENVKDMQFMYYGCVNLLSDDTENYTNAINVMDTGACETMRYMFTWDRSIENPNISSWDVSKVQDIGCIFMGCVKAKISCDANAEDRTNIKDWNVSSIENMIGAFANPELSLEEPGKLEFNTTSSGGPVEGVFDLSCWNGRMGKVKLASMMFADNDGITKLGLNVSMDFLEDATAFAAWCPNIIEIDGSTFSADALTYACGMFTGTGAAGSIVDMRGWDMASLEQGRLMYYKSGFRTINLDGTNPSMLRDALGMFGECTNLVSLGSRALSDWTLPLAESAAYMFHGDRMLTAVNVSNMDFASCSDFSYMFGECESLTNVIFTDWNMERAEKIDGLLYGCIRINEVSLTGLSFPSLKSAFASFAKMSGLVRVNISGADFPQLENVSGMFWNDVSLQELNMDNSSFGKIKDASGFLYHCGALTSLDGRNLLGASTTDASYMLSGCRSLTALNASLWYTSSVKYFQGLFDGCVSLSSLKTGDGLKGSAARSAAIMFRGCEQLPTLHLQQFVTKLGSMTVLEDANEMFASCKSIKSINLSGMSFEKVSAIHRMFYGNEQLTNIIIPATFGSAADETSKNIFYVPADTNTILKITGTGTIPNYIAGYDWSEDHRIFMQDKGCTINGERKTVWMFDKDNEQDAVLSVNVESSLYVNDKPVSLTYEWRKAKEALEEKGESYTAAAGSVGEYICSASIPKLEKGTKITHSFQLLKADYVSSITAEYNGPDIPLTKEYKKEDVLVKAYMNGSTKNGVELSPEDFSLNSQTVSQKGENTYTATYIDGDGEEHKADFSVNGIRVLDSIVAEYTGPAIYVGKEYDTSYVTVIGYYEDDKEKQEGFSVTPDEYSGKKVEKRGENTFHVSYLDKEQNKTFTASYVVTGYSPVASITAVYTGPDIEQGKNYDKEKVTVTVHYVDSDETHTVKDFTLDSQMVSNVGDNSYTATWIDPMKNNHSASFTVKGYKANKTEPSNPDNAGSGNNHQGSGDSNMSVAAPAQTSAPNNFAVSNVQTGDENMPLFWGMASVVLGALFVGILFIRRKYRKEKENGGGIWS